jgi:YfiH family protein
MKKERLARPLPLQWKEGIVLAQLAQDVKIGYTSRLWGDGKEKSLELKGADCVFRQTSQHTSLVREVDSDMSPEIMDGCFSAESGLALTSLFADCLPLYFGTRDGKWIGLVHSGWKGSLEGIAQNMVQALRRKTGDAACDLHCVLGPYRGLWYYEVQADFKKTFRKTWSVGWIEDCFGEKNGQLYFDNGVFNLLLLQDLGLVDLSFIDLELGEDERLYSHRRGETGRNVAFIYKEMGE